MYSMQHLIAKNVRDKSNLELRRFMAYNIFITVNHNLNLLTKEGEETACQTGPSPDDVPRLIPLSLICLFGHLRLLVSGPDRGLALE